MTGNQPSLSRGSHWKASPSNHEIPERDGIWRRPFSLKMRVGMGLKIELIENLQKEKWEPQMPFWFLIIYSLVEKGKGLPENRVKAVTLNVRPFTPYISILTARLIPSRQQFVGVVSEGTVQEKGSSETDIKRKDPQKLTLSLSMRWWRPTWLEMHM